MIELPLRIEVSGFTVHAGYRLLSSERIRLACDEIEDDIMAALSNLGGRRATRGVVTITIPRKEPS